MKKYILILIILILPATVIAQEMSGTSYKVKHGIFAISGFIGGTSVYNLQDIVGVNGLGTMSGSAYALNWGFYDLNSLPGATIASYNDSWLTEDTTPTLEWVYFDADNDTQKRYRLQISRTDFITNVVDTGEVSSSGISYTTSALPRTEERELYKWRVRVYDGFGWSGWALAGNGFILTEGGFLITGLSALTSPGGETIEESAWQKDNDPYFYWEAPVTGLEVLGYSYALDALADDEIDTPNTYYYFGQDDISDGAHTFYVKAQRSSGLWGESATFNIWVDTTAPTVNNMTPGLGGVFSEDQPEVGALLSDVASGINPETIEMKINQAQVSPLYNSETGKVSYVPFIPFSDGEIIVSLLAQDAVGNYGAPLTWSFTIDTEGPEGSVLINNGDEMTTTNIVTLNISGQDEITNITESMLSNDGVFDTETWEPYTSLRRNWALAAIDGMRRVYVRIKDEAGNISESFFDDINLVIIAPDTYILSGPPVITRLPEAEFTFRGSLDDCQFSYKFDNENWSDWSSEISISKTNLSEGNHYFTVKAAKDLNRD
ncbi:MAG: hypothetical protein ISS27_03610, partial [Candidatus Omnitrophica bacterium]|nr:hypothetical protein [Candidatus Omnitrophota bacterium]